MPVEVLMPRLGWTMEEGLFVDWIKHDGDTVKSGDILFTVETDKAINEVECLDDGLLRLSPNAPKPGDIVKVGALMGYILTRGEAMPSDTAPATQPIAPGQPAQESPATSLAAAQPAGQADAFTISPRARRVAGELGIDPAQLAGSGRTGRIVERDVRAAAAVAHPEQSVPLRVSPLARRAAEELGVDLAQLPAAKTGQRIERADVERAARGASPAEPAFGETRLPLTTVRRLTAERVSAGVHIAAPVTLTTEVDATELVRMRTQLKNDVIAGRQLVPSYNDLLLKLLAHALLEHPALNARLEADAIVRSPAVAIGLAVDTDRGLLVPVLREVQSKGLRQLAQESASLIERARTGRLGPDEMTGGTFSLTNLGMYDIDLFTPIVNLPECAILGVGRIRAMQVVVDAAAERVAIRQMMGLSLTVDHRLVDGAPAARFLQRVKQLIEQPYVWLVA